MKQRFFLLALVLCLGASAQTPVNYDENAIEPYDLPELLVSASGKILNTSSDWENIRRKEILDLFENEVYGVIPDRKLPAPTVKVLEESANALGGIAIRKQVALTFSNQGKSLTIHLLLYLPKGVEAPPIFVGYNFFGNHTIIDDENIVLTESWMYNNEDFGISNNQASDASRGVRNNRWPVEKIINEGFGLAALYYGDVDPDRDDFTDGIHPLFYKPGQQKPEAHEWGSIAAWAWGYSRVLDYIEAEQPESPTILFGHSRLGKTSLWAGAIDTRFDIVISNNSGCGGAALSKRKIGETVGAINRRFPHWFADNFNRYNDKEESLPIDQHMLIAMIAPRPVYIASAEDDRWADPKGEYLAGYYASPVYQLYGMEGLTDPEPPGVNTPIHTIIGYHIRTGKHDVTDYDWKQYMAFARKHLE